MKGSPERFQVRLPIKRARGRVGRREQRCIGSSHIAPPYLSQQRGCGLYFRFVVTLDAQSVLERGRAH